MKASLQLKIGQQLTMTPQLQQAIRLLQLSSLDLHQEIQQNLYDNPLLELAEESENLAAETATRKNEDIDSATRDLNSSEWDNKIPTDLPVDANWDDIYQPSTPIRNTGADTRDFDSVHNVTESLQDHLIWQLNLTPMSPKDYLIGEMIIDSIDSRGMLTAPIEEIWAALDDEIELDEVLAVVHRIQQFDPPGVAATSLAECLLIQLNQFSPDTPLINEAIQLVTDHLELVGQRNFRQMEKITGLPHEILEGAILLIQTLSPNPGDAIRNDDIEYVVPDVRVTKADNHWKVSLNEDITPRLSINQQYAQLIRRADSSQDNTFLKNHLQEAKWFLRSMESRNDTLMRVTSCIIELQQGFLEQGPVAMKPMVLADIAERLELHESTISRVTTQKYIDTPQGVFELKYFFSSHVSTDAGGECSSTAIRAMLKKMVSAENPGKPLSDNKLTALLQEMGIQVARRTVAKYREGMGIPSSSERKRYNPNT
ncbi:RNA polymerase factor sigma-54 [uncultured Porticoccus sp.]|uniref:RNA polymerase factor sigma-54 n=1 Tax=uncultured Porticoccus sp. TaxID=1256050 RepID=UPI00261BC98D|nr:RNA polymerase factor sigma-54 [uncultured Porticoccus sp.]